VPVASVPDAVQALALEAAPIPAEMRAQAPIPNRIAIAWGDFSQATADCKRPWRADIRTTIAKLLCRILGANGLLVVCDHSPPEDMIPFTALYATEVEQHAALSAAGFINVRTHLSVNGLYICVGQRPSNIG